MRPLDVDILLHRLLPALSLTVAACTGTNSASSGGEAPGTPAVADAQGKASSPSDAEDGEDDDGDDAEAGNPDAVEPKADLGQAPRPEPEMKPDWNRPTCPTVTWCASQAAASKVAVEGSETLEGCPAEVTSERPLKTAAGKKGAPDLTTDPVYSSLFLRSRTGPVGLDLAGTQSSREAGNADACCYSWTRPCPGGRPFVDGASRPIVAPLRRGEAWSDRRFELHASAAAKAEAARQWLDDAAAEHASVASFARTTLELMALGAPPELIARTQRAALDELEHAKTCLAIARACGAPGLEPGPMPVEGPRAADFARFAVDTFVEGCVGETTAALALRRAARNCGDDALRLALLAIAEDETEHAALAWQSVSWALERGGEPVRDALARRAAAHLAALASASISLRDGPPELAELAALGRLSAPELHQTERDAWFGVIEPMLARI